jgi:hypothetical protein
MGLQQESGISEQLVSVFKFELFRPHRNSIMSKTKSKNCSIFVIEDTT